MRATCGIRTSKPSSRGSRSPTLRELWLALAVLIGTAGLAAQSPAPPDPQPLPIDDTITAAESDAPARRLVSFNEYEGPLGSIRIGGGVLYDYAAFGQDAASREQVALDSQWKYRDGRVLLSGRLNFKRPTTWSAGIMYDGAKKEWVFRQTGIMVA